MNKGDLLVKIKPDFYVANRNQAEATYKSSLAGKATAEAQLAKAVAEFKRNQDLFTQNLVSASIFDEVKAAYAVATAQVTNAGHQVEMAKAQLASADEQLAKTTIVAPLSGTISRLNSQLGERVLGTVQNLGTDIMTIADLDEMEARVEMGEIDVVLIRPGQKVRLEVDAFKDQKFSGMVTEIANSAKGSSGLGLGAAQSQEATKFEVRIRIQEKESFRPGMSVTAEIETRSRTNALTVPIAAVTTRLPKGTNVAANATNSPGQSAASAEDKVAGKTDRKREGVKAQEVVFVVESERVKMTPVKIGISDDDYWEITEGLTEDQEIVSGGYKAVSRELEDGKLVKVEKAPLGDNKVASKKE